MTTPKRAEANRRNAQKSTGPKTPEGKDRSRFNALKHGMAAKLPVLPGENAEAYQGRTDTWTADLQPRNDVERDLVERAARASWQLERVELIEIAILTERIRDAPSDDPQAADRLSFDDSEEGERLRRFELSCRRTLLRSLETLLKIRRAGEGLPRDTAELDGVCSGGEGETSGKPMVLLREGETPGERIPMGLGRSLALPDGLGRSLALPVDRGRCDVSSPIADSELPSPSVDPTEPAAVPASEPALPIDDRNSKNEPTDDAAGRELDPIGMSPPCGSIVEIRRTNPPMPARSRPVSPRRRPIVEIRRTNPPMARRVGQSPSIQPDTSIRTEARRRIGPHPRAREVSFGAPHQQPRCRGSPRTTPQLPRNQSLSSPKTGDRSQ
jgi:hypothetical protein